MEEQPVKQAFGSPGGKTYLAPKIVGMIPPHRVYVEPFVGGGAVYFRKSPSEVEVLSDKDREIAFAFKFLRDMTPEQFERLKRYDWRVRAELFSRLKASVPKDDVERFRRFYYLKKGSYAKGSKTIDPLRVEAGTPIRIDHLWKVHERLRRTAIHGGDALAMIRKYDSPSSFFYLDPPYPDRAFVGAKDKYTEEDLARLIEKLEGIKGRFALSLGTEHAKLLPKNWHVKRVAVKRPLMMRAGEPLPVQYEIIATNYNPDLMPKISAYRRRNRRKTQTRRRANPLSMPVLAGMRI